MEEAGHRLRDRLPECRLGGEHVRRKEAAAGAGEQLHGQVVDQEVHGEGAGPLGAGQEAEEVLRAAVQRVAAGDVVLKEVAQGVDLEFGEFAGAPQLVFGAELELEAGGRKAPFSQQQHARLALHGGHGPTTAVRAQIGWRLDHAQCFVGEGKSQLGAFGEQLPQPLLQLLAGVGEQIDVAAMDRAGQEFELHVGDFRGDALEARGEQRHRRQRRWRTKPETPVLAFAAPRPGNQPAGRHFDLQIGHEVVATVAMRIVASGGGTRRRHPEHARHERHIAFVEDRRFGAQQRQHRATGDGGHVDGRIQIGEVRVRHAVDGEGQRQLRRRRRRGHAQQAVLVLEGRVPPIDAQRLDRHAWVQREQQVLRHALDIEPVVQLDCEAISWFDDDPAVDALHSRQRSVAHRVMCGAPFGALRDRPMRGVCQRRDADDGERDRNAASGKPRAGGVMIRARMQPCSDNQESARQQQLASALGEVGRLRETRQHVGAERERGDAAERRRLMRRHVGHHPPGLCAEQRQGHDRDNQPVPRQHREQNHQRTPQDQRRWRVHEQEHRHRVRLHGVAERPLAGHRERAQPLHEKHGDDQSQPCDQYQAGQPSAKQRQVAERSRIEHVGNALASVARTHIEGEEDDRHDHHPKQEGAHAGKDEARIDQADAGRQPRHHAVDAGVVDIGQEAEQDAQHGEQPSAHQAAHRAHFRYRNRPETMQLLHVQCSTSFGLKAD